MLYIYYIYISQILSYYVNYYYFFNKNNNNNNNKIDLEKINSVVCSATSVYNYGIIIKSHFILIAWAPIYAW
jgi:hypothetical protein